VTLSVFSPLHLLSPLHILFLSNGPGRLDKEIELNVPSSTDRAQILLKLFKSMGVIISDADVTQDILEQDVKEKLENNGSEKTNSSKKEEDNEKEGKNDKIGVRKGMDDRVCVSNKSGDVSTLEHRLSNLNLDSTSSNTIPIVKSTSVLNSTSSSSSSTASTSTSSSSAASRPLTASFIRDVARNAHGMVACDLLQVVKESFFLSLDRHLAGSVGGPKVKDVDRSGSGSSSSSSSSSGSSSSSVRGIINNDTPSCPAIKCSDQDGADDSNESVDKSQPISSSRSISQSNNLSANEGGDDDVHRSDEGDDSDRRGNNDHDDDHNRGRDKNISQDNSRGRESGRERERESGRERGRERGRESGRERGRERGREIERQSGRERGADSRTKQESLPAVAVVVKGGESDESFRPTNLLSDYDEEDEMTDDDDEEEEKEEEEEGDDDEEKGEAVEEEMAKEIKSKVNADERKDSHKVNDSVSTRIVNVHNQRSVEIKIKSVNFKDVADINNNKNGKKNENSDNTLHMNKNKNAKEGDLVSDVTTPYDPSILLEEDVLVAFTRISPSALRYVTHCSCDLTNHRFSDFISLILLISCSYFH
jgi:hypothetical protein